MTREHWQKERGGGGLLYETATRYGRLYQALDDRWIASRRPHPYNKTAPGWEGPRAFVNRGAAEAWIEAPSEKELRDAQEIATVAPPHIEVSHVVG